MQGQSRLFGGTVGSGRDSGGWRIIHRGDIHRNGGVTNQAAASALFR